MKCTENLCIFYTGSNIFIPRVTSISRVESRAGVQMKMIFNVNSSRDLKFRSFLLLEHCNLFIYDYVQCASWNSCRKQQQKTKQTIKQFKPETKRHGNAIQNDDLNPMLVMIWLRRVQCDVKVLIFSFFIAILIELKFTDR